MATRHPVRRQCCAPSGTACTATAAAHELAQAQDDAEGAWVRVWLHYIEGDLGNADYWYRRAGRPLRRDDTRDEGLEIARALLRA